jgi:diaminopropionate ammonia-lyase
VDVFVNSAVRRDAGYRGMFEPAEYTRVTAFYDAHPELAPSPLRSLPGLAAELSLAELLIKDETGRFGLEAFKIAGARYAIEQIGRPALSNGVVCATAGNHGRAVARAAREIDVPCSVFVPAARPGANEVELRTRRNRVEAMRADGAQTVEVGGTYEEAVRRAAEHARTTGAAVVSDTSWPGYEHVPRLIMLGYTRIFEEAARQWSRPPDVLLVQGGVGGLVCAAANWSAARYGPRRPFLIACEPESSACLLESARAGRLVNLDDPRPQQPEPDTDERRPTDGGSEVVRSADGGGNSPRSDGGRRPANGGNDPPSTVMAGLRCAEPSAAAWPSIAFGVDAFLSIPDSLALEAIDRLARPIGGDEAINAGPSGACGVGALFALLAASETVPLRRACGLRRSTRVMAIVTEAP